MKFASTLLGLMLTLPVFAQESCPTGQYQVCLVVCFCAPVDPNQSGQVLQDVERMATSSLVFALRQARDEATASGSQPIPLHIRAQLEPWYDFAVLDAARYRVGDEQQISAANALLQNPDVNAVTLIDTIIFRRSADAEDNVALWAHELATLTAELHHPSVGAALKSCVRIDDGTRHIIARDNDLRSV
ncbi:DUF4157 domain-containing protein [Pseudomonas mosselii]|uniref:eCIS core domain-containing protein n=1 Tax=Pseudomonas mosselii TaxID=78327 RepID=UPI002022CA9D|nr:DUF4157 domain-containing protein [Pseudomonas mosselii]MCL8298346.1 DUF4157 domain-containing protein [Pseudomonas mosselii]